MDDADIRARVKEALGRTEIMALSTVGSDGPWTSPVQYTYDDRLQLSFLSMPDAKHVRNILVDSRVSVAIYQFPGPPGGNLGLQIRGHAVDRDIGSSSPGGWHRFTIKPDEVWLFDSRVFGRRRQIVDLSLLGP